MALATVRPVLGDAFSTATFVFISSIWDELGEMLSEFGISPIAAGLTVVVIGLALFEPIGQYVGGHGSSWNPATNACFATAGKGSPIQHVLRVAGQALGAVLGAAAAFYLVPLSWQGKFKNLGGGLRPGVTLSAGFACELLLGFSLHIIVLWSMGMKNKTWGFTTPLIATIFLVLAGMELTGPSLNPAVTFAWAVHHREHALIDHVLVFWLAPISGGALAGLLWTWATAAGPKKRTRPSPAKIKSIKNSGTTSGKANPNGSSVKLAVRAGESSKKEN